MRSEKEREKGAKMNLPNDLLYTNDHEWVKIDDGIATIGITDFAQSELGDIIFVEFPEIEDEFEREDVFGTIEAVKTVADMLTPISGVITAVNPALEDSPELVNQDPYGDGWLIKLALRETEDVSHLLTPETYGKLIN